MTNRKNGNKKPESPDRKHKDHRAAESGGKDAPGDSARDTPTRKTSLGKYLVLTLIVVVATAAGLYVIDYIRLAPVREARQKLAEKDYGYAVTVLNDYLISHPEDRMAMALKARAHAGLEEFDKCAEIYEEIEGVSDIFDMFAFAKSLTVLEKYAEGYSNWMGVMAKITDGELDDLPAEEKNALIAEALYFMAACQTELGKIDRAWETANDLKHVPGHEVIGHYLMGLVEVKRGNELTAIEEWNHVLELDPEISQLKIPPYLFLYEMGILKVEQGKPEEGIRDLARSLELNGMRDLERYANSMEAIGSAYEELGNNEEAKKSWSRLVELEQRAGGQLKPSLVAREGLANLALIEKQPEKAVGFLVPLRDAGNVKSSTTYLMQRALAMMGKETEARQFQELTRELREKETKINTIREALKERPNSHWSAVLRAYDFAQEGNWGQAEKLLGSVREYLNDDFSKRFLDAVKNRKPLPPLTDIPLDVF